MHTCLCGVLGTGAHMYPSVKTVCVCVTTLGAPLSLAKAVLKSGRGVWHCPTPLCPRTRPLQSLEPPSILGPATSLRVPRGPRSLWMADSGLRSVLGC